MRRDAASAASGVPCESTPRSKSRRIPAPATPSRPETATISPGRAPERSTGSRPSRSPNAVTAMVRTDDTERSPPTTPQPGDSAAQASRKPSAIPSRSDTGEFSGAAIATTNAVGTAPIAATSARLDAAAFQPRSTGVDQASRKSGPWIIMSVVTTNLPSGAATTAASSPAPRSWADAAGSRGNIRSRAAASPIPPSVSSVVLSWRIVMYQTVALMR